MTRTVAIDSLSTSVQKYDEEWAVVAVDVIRATTTITTAISMGRLVYPARTTDEAFAIARLLDRPLFVGELGGNVPYGYDLTNSPVQVAALNLVDAGPFTDPERPLVVTSSSGVPLILEARSQNVYASCLRNLSAMSSYLAERHDKIVVIGAGTRGEFRREDQLGCAWLAERLVAAGYEAQDENTSALIERWRGSDLKPIREGKSADYLRRSGQIFDLEFVLSHMDDLRVVPHFKRGMMTDALKQ